MKYIKVNKQRAREGEREREIEKKERKRRTNHLGSGWMDINCQSWMTLAHHFDSNQSYLTGIFDGKGGVY